MLPLGTPAPAGEPPALPLSDRRSEAVLSLALVTELERAYPAVNVAQQLGKMRAWLLSKPANRKTRGGLVGFVNTWLSKEQDRALPANGGPPRPARRADRSYLDSNPEVTS